jgi:hypothetical protein
LTKDLNNLTCEEYSEEMILEDDNMTVDCYEGANSEAHKAEENARIEMIMNQTKIFEEERKKLEDEFGH